MRMGQGRLRSRLPAQPKNVEDDGSTGSSAALLEQGADDDADAAATACASHFRLHF